MRFQFKTEYNDDIRLYQDRVQLAWYVALLITAVSLPLFLGDFYISQVTFILIFSIAGMGIMLLVGHTGLVSLGHAAFLAAGAYSTVNLELLGVPFFLALPLGGLFAGVLGAVLAIPVLRLTGIYLAIATLALAIIIEDIIVLAEPLTGGVVGLSVDSIYLFSAAGPEINIYFTPFRFYYLALAVAALVALLYANILRSSTGRAFLAIRDSEVSARAMGINVARYKTLSFGLSCFITGLAGGLLAHFLGHINHEAFLILTSIELLMIVVIGGLGSIHGAFFGAIVFGMLPLTVSIAIETFGAPLGITSTTLPGLSTGIFAGLLVMFILVEPFGIYGRWLKIRTYFQLFPLYRRDMFRRHKSYLKTERMR